MRAARVAMIAGILLLTGGCRGGRGLTPAPDAPSGQDQQLSQATLTLELTGTDLRALDSDAQTGLSFGDYCQVAILRPKEVLRRIEPGDIPYGAAVGSIEFGGGCAWEIDGLPANEALLLQVAFKPDVDLTTGEPFSAQHPPRLFAVHIPITCAAGGSLVVGAQIEVSLQPDGGYCADTLATLSDAGDETRLATRLDYGAGRVSRDSDLDGSFSDEAWLADTARLGISERLIARLAAENAAQPAATQPVTLRGRLDSIDEAGGSLRLLDTEVLTEGGRVRLDTLAVSFEEGSTFDLRLVNEQGEAIENSPPAAISSEHPVTIRAELLKDHLDPALDVHWAQTIEDLQLELPVDSVIAVPLKQAAVPGEPVTVTVYANRTANPFHAVDNLRIALEADNGYEAQSFNVGDRGGAATLADGLWAGIDTDEVLLNVLAGKSSSESNEDRQFIDVQLAPGAGGDLELATGALLNFNLVCHADATPAVVYLDGDLPATTFTDGARNTYTWRNKVSVTSRVNVEGQPLVLDLVDPPSVGAGRKDNPYLAEPGASYQLRLIDPFDGDVSVHHATAYALTSLDNGAVTIEGNMLEIGADYVGPIGVEAIYQGIHSQPASNPQLFVDSTAGFKLNVHEPQTYILGGSAAGWELEYVPRGEEMLVKVSALGAIDLCALYLDLRFDPALYYLADFSGTKAMQIGDGLLLPSLHFLTPRLDEGVVDYGQVLLSPQQQHGFTGNGSLVTFEFTRAPAPSCRMGFQLPDESCAELAWDAQAGRLRWRYLLPGDFNQDGQVFITNMGGHAYTDWTMLAMYFGTEGQFEPDSIEYVIDRWDDAQHQLGSDGLIRIQEVTPIGMHYMQRLTGWNVFGGSAADYPAGGELLGHLPFAQYHGDPAAERIWFSWTPAQTAPDMTFWVRPELDGEEGEASTPVAVP